MLNLGSCVAMLPAQVMSLSEAEVESVSSLAGYVREKGKNTHSYHIGTTATNNWSQ